MKKKELVVKIIVSCIAATIILSCVILQTACSVKDYNFSVIIDFNTTEEYDTKIIRSQSELLTFARDEYSKQKVEKYTDEFFSSHYLIFVYHLASSGPPEYRISKLYRTGNHLQVNIVADWAEETYPMAQRFIAIVIELDTSIEIETVSASITERKN